MATPKKLPSGNWRVRVYDYTDESNVRHYRSFTAATKKECSYMAAEFSQNKSRIAAGDLTVAEAIDEYIRVKSEVLSHSTICIPMEYLSFAEGCVNGPVCKRGKEIC